MNAGECVRLSVHGIVAQEFEQGAMIGVAAGLREYVDLGARMSEFGGVNADLNFEFLNGINRRKDDIGIEIGVCVVDAVERVVVEHDPLPTRRDGLVGAVASLPGTSLACGWREGVH